MDRASPQEKAGARQEQEELEALHRLDEECIHLQRAVRLGCNADTALLYCHLMHTCARLRPQGDYVKAFDCMERALVLRRDCFGVDSDEVRHACKALAEMSNLLSMSFLQQDNYTVALDLLKKAEVLAQHDPVEKATTLNNLACYYRRLGKLHTAMTCLKRALEIEQRLRDVRNAADTHLNLCAVLSQLGRHEQAHEQAQQALSALEIECFSKSLAEQPSAHKDSEQHMQPQQTRLDRISVMCIAFHNMGVEQEFLKDYESSVSSYKKGVGLAEQYLGTDHAITATIRNSYLAAKRTIATKNGGRRRSKGQDFPNKSTLGNSFRMPSPLSTQQSPTTLCIPTPRSIVAQALSRPAQSLPALNASSKTGVATDLSPEDPFFSPRFRFEADGKRQALRDDHQPHPSNDVLAAHCIEASGSIPSRAFKLTPERVPPTQMEVWSDGGISLPLEPAHQGLEQLVESDGGDCQEIVATGNRDQLDIAVGVAVCDDQALPSSIPLPSGGNDDQSAAWYGVSDGSGVAANSGDKISGRCTDMRREVGGNDVASCDDQALTPSISLPEGDEDQSGACIGESDASGAMVNPEDIAGRCTDLRDGMDGDCVIGCDDQALISTTPLPEGGGDQSGSWPMELDANGTMTNLEGMIAGQGADGDQSEAWYGVSDANGVAMNPEDKIAGEDADLRDEVGGEDSSQQSSTETRSIQGTWNNDSSMTWQQASTSREMNADIFPDVPCVPSVEDALPPEPCVQPAFVMEALFTSTEEAIDM